MEASSRVALEQVRERLTEHTRPAPGGVGQPRGVIGDRLLGLAGELFAVARLLDAQPTLRRALADPSGQPEDRAGLARRLFSERVSAEVADLVESSARQRWSRPGDLVDAMQALGTDAALEAADARGELDEVEDQLFRFGRIVAGDRELSRILGDRTAPAEGKAALLDRLVGGKVSPVTEALLRNELTRRRTSSAEVAVEQLSEAASRRRGRSVARVTSAVPLTDAQERRLADVLGRIYGRTIGLQVTVDPEVLGGLVVRVGDEVIDGSIAHRLEAAHRRLAG
ncbi:F0F1 ATP synthase subunit delta [Geodermatophilus sp. YIM 151500]|uniref:F0F1 ATP synthase subunit delta n=1 Tax=Geodermatophilus sp. YIM 151500 TaxID=2984531 RepID=UPI0021E505F3|nr:F0F1 ATP synthase subunit delta [Geodermatophilus sp. YIM 151500]MCV2488767.1 F0F1 ATP synthase subunit delta [Geodermatophilus sp. YIM 151500]